MRTTVSLDDDVVAAVDQVRRQRGLGLSQAVNELVRAGLAAAPPQRERVRLATTSLHLRIDVTNVADALEAAEEPGLR